MQESGGGAILIGHGASAVHPMAEMSGVGPVMAATRNYLHSLHAEVDGSGPDRRRGNDRAQRRPPGADVGHA